MSSVFRLLGVLVALILLLAPHGAAAQGNPGPLRIEITEGVIEPLPVAVPSFVAENPAA